MTIHVLAPKGHPVFTGRRRRRWCFGCRKRLPHREMVLFHDMTDYPPVFWWECPRCRKDRTKFGS